MLLILCDPEGDHAGEYRDYAECVDAGIAESLCGLLNAVGDSSDTLIAAAPDLLMFARQVLPALDAHGCQCKNWYLPGELCPLCVAKAAVAKAEGR